MTGDYGAVTPRCTGDQPAADAAGGSPDPACATQDVENFHFAACSIDVARVRALLAAGAISPTRTSVDIVEWAEKVLLLRRDRPHARPMSMWVGIDHDHAASLDDARLCDEIYIVHTRYGPLVADGNHRVARGYLLGRDELPALCFGPDIARHIVRYADEEPALRIREPSQLRRRSA